MTPDEMIRFEGVGKRYRLGVNFSYKTMAEQLASLFIRKPEIKQKEKKIWAVRDINLTVKRGEVLGIIGRNGAGKSTLLKLLTRITQPTCGRIQYKGRIGALLEVGTGFHPELTGLENIMMNGLILGMTRAEIRSRLDEIIDFAGVEKFLDTPVKRYSSGMRVRLGFAIAAHLDPEILIVDEVLAVGDAEFQRKCLNRMSHIGEEGRTVIFVSHQMDAIQRLCHKTMIMQAGQIIKSGPTDEIVQAYLHDSFHGREDIPINQRTDRAGDGRYKVTELKIHDGDGKSPRTGADMFIDLSIEAQENQIILADAAVRIGLFDKTERLITILSNHNISEPIKLENHLSLIRCKIASLPLLSGKYWVNFSLRCNNDLADKVQLAKSFEVHAGTQEEAPNSSINGVIQMQEKWKNVLDISS